MKSQVDVIDINERTNRTGERDFDRKMREKEAQRMREKKRRIRKRKQKLQILWLVMSVTCMVAAVLIGAAFFRTGASDNKIQTSGSVLGNALENDAENKGDTALADTEAAESGTTPVELKYEVGTPQILEGDAITQRLQELAVKYPEFQDICENTSAYPEKLLAALCNNPEMIDFVKGYLTADKTAAGELTDAEKNEAHPHFLQWDARWGYITYGDDILALSGCGPTCLSMVVVALTENKDTTPADVAEFAMDNNYYMMGTGTMWKLMSEGALHYGLTAVELEFEETAMKNCIDNGGMIIATMAPGDFTAVGHFIVIYGYDAEGFLVNDPNCLARSQTKWSFETLTSQMKKMWGYQ
jgi:hypothetical protein